MRHVPPDAPLVFVLPSGSDLPSGGNLYNQALLEALEARVVLRRISLEKWRAEVAAGVAGLFFLDSLDLAEIVGVTPREGQYFGLLVHHLPSLEPELPDRERQVSREAAALAKFDLLLCTSGFTSELLRSRGFEAERLLTVPPAPPAVRASARRYAPPLRALIVANLIPRKGILELFEVLLNRKEPAEFRLVIVGRGDLDAPYAGACHAAVRGSSYLAERVRIDAAVSHERMLEYWESADLLLSPATMETFGMAVQEARAHGLPVVVRDGGFVREQVNEGVNGHVVFELEALADALFALARDATRMSELFAGAQRTRPAAGYGWPEAAESFLAKLGRAPAE